MRGGDRSKNAMVGSKKIQKFSIDAFDHVIASNQPVTQTAMNASPIVPYITICQRFLGDPSWNWPTDASKTLQVAKII